MEKAPENFDGTEPQEILTLAGMALYQAQVLEVAVTNLAVALHLSGRLKITGNLVLETFYKLNAQTLGKIINEVRKLIHLAPDFDDRLKIVLDRRNCLIHRFFRLHDVNLLTAPGREEMAAELHLMIDEFYNSHKEVELLYTPLWSSLGLTQERIEAALRQLRQLAADRHATLNRDAVADAGRGDKAQQQVT